MRIICFLEDRAQENFICALVRRLAGELQVPVHIDVRSARGGASVFSELSKFLDSLSGFGEVLVPGRDVLLVVADADQDRRKRLKQLRKRVGKDLVPLTVFCVPDPHIERWYVLDEKALEDVAGVRLTGEPRRKNRDYKSVLKKIVDETGSLYGGIEYGADLAERMDLEMAARRDESFRQFLEDLRFQLRHLKR